MFKMITTTNCKNLDGFFMQPKVVLVISKTAVSATSIGRFILRKKKLAFCETRLESFKKSACNEKVLIAINNVCAIKQSVNCDDYIVLK